MICTDKICFIHLPKTGGTFVRMCMGDIFDNTYFDDGGSGLKEHSYPEKKMDQYTFGFIRNPFDWYVSLWCHVKKKPDGIKRTQKYYDEDFNMFLNSLLCNPSLRIGGNKGWLSKVVFSDMHIAGVGLLTYMHDMMYVYVDEVCMFEDIRVEAVRMFSNLGVSNLDVVYNIPPAKSSDRLHYHNYYNDESRDIVSKMDKVLLEKYGYNF